MDVRVSGEAGGRGLVFSNTLVRVQDGAYSEMHIETDEANAAGIRVGAEGELARDHSATPVPSSTELEFAERRHHPTRPEEARVSAGGRTPGPHRRARRLHRARHPRHRGRGRSPSGQRRTSANTEIRAITAGPTPRVGLRSGGMSILQRRVVGACRTGRGAVAISQEHQEWAGGAFHRFPVGARPRENPKAEHQCAEGSGRICGGNGLVGFPRRLCGFEVAPEEGLDLAEIPVHDRCDFGIVRPEFDRRVDHEAPHAVGVAQRRFGDTRDKCANAIRRRGQPLDLTQARAGSALRNCRTRLPPTRRRQPTRRRATRGTRRRRPRRPKPARMPLRQHRHRRRQRQRMPVRRRRSR